MHLKAKGGRVKKTIIRNEALDERTYPIMVHLIRGSCPKFIKNSYNSPTKKTQTIP